MGIQTSSINNGPTAGLKNAVINGNFDIWQRGTSLTLTPSTEALQFIADRWAVTTDTTGGTKAMSQQAFTVGQTDVPNNPTYFLRYTVTGASTGGTYNAFIQRIEDVRTFAGQQVTLSFYAKTTSAFTMPSIQLEQRFGTGGSPSAGAVTQLVANASIGTSWTKYTYTTTLPSISGKTIGTDDTDNLTIAFICPLNSTFTFDVAQVQLEQGPVATNFESRPIGLELELCERYYETSTRAVWVNSTYVTGAYTAVGTGHQAFKTTKRANPTTTVSYNYSLDNATTASLVDTINGGFIFSLGINSFSSSPYARAVITYTANADTLI